MLRATGVFLAAFFFAACARAAGEGSVEVFAGTAARPPLEAAARLFEAETGAKVLLHFGGSGAMLSQIELLRRGDVYFPGSSDFMELAKRKGLTDPATEVRIAYLLPALAVPKGNPKNVRELKDLARPGLRVGLARPDAVCVGLYGVEVLDAQGLSDAVRPNVVLHAESCEKVAQMVSLGLVDVALGWDVFGKWNPGDIEIVPLAPGQTRRIGYLPASLTAFPRNPETARAFLKFLAGPKGKAVFREAGYLVEVEDARRLAGEGAQVGGEWTLPREWRK